VKENGRNAWNIKAAFVLCSLGLVGRSETPAVTRLGICWLKPLVPLVPVEQMVLHKMHTHT